MRTVTLSGTPIETSRLGFGCAGLFRVSTSRGRRRLLEEAHLHGLRHFDVARSYGLGAAERELGAFAKGRRDKLVLATKFGLENRGAVGRLGKIQRPARQLISAFPALRSVARASSGAMYARRRYDGESLRGSLEKSLRELGTDHVDLLFLHEPLPEQVRTEDVCAALEDAQEAGLVRAWGISGEPEPTAEVARAFPIAVPVLQVHDDPLQHSGSAAQNEVPARISFGVLGDALRVLVEHLADGTLRRRWWTAVGADCGDPAIAARLLLRRALHANPSGVVLFSTTRWERIRDAAETAESGDFGSTDSSLEVFRRLLAELRLPEGASHGDR